MDGVSYTVYAGQTLAIVGESGSGKTVSCRAVHGAAAAGRGGHRLGPVRRHRADRADRRRAAAAPRRGRRDGVPGPGPVAEPDHADRQPRSPRRSGPTGGQPGRGPRAGRRPAAPGAHPAARAALRRVPAPAVRRHAAARHDRDRAGLPPPAAHRRRGHHRARRHHPGADHGAAARAAGRAGHGADADQPRPRPGGGLRRRGDRDVRRPDRRAGPGRRGCSGRSGCRTPRPCSRRSRGSSAPRTRRSR